MSVWGLSVGLLVLILLSYATWGKTWGMRNSGFCTPTTKGDTRQTCQQEMLEAKTRYPRIRQITLLITTTSRWLSPWIYQQDLVYSYNNWDSSIIYWTQPFRETDKVLEKKCVVTFTNIMKTVMDKIYGCGVQENDAQPSVPSSFEPS